MAITGGIKFFERNQARADTATASGSTGNSSAPKVIDGNIYTKWESVGSDDTTAETLTIDFTNPVTLDRILLANMNWKDFSVQYDSGSGLTAFTSVVGLDGALGGGLVETAFADTTAYYEFAQVTGVNQLVFTVNKTQTADEEKRLFRLFAMTELGTLVGYPEPDGPNHERNRRVSRTLSGKKKVQSSFSVAEMKLRFRSYPTASAFRADVTLMETLFDRDETFLVWPCGGRRGEDYFRHTPKGWGLDDVFEMAWTGGWDPAFRSGSYVNGVNAVAEFEESIP